MGLNDDYGDAPEWIDEPWAGFYVSDLEVPDTIDTSRVRQDIDGILADAWINGVTNAFSGDCPAVAGALARFFEAETLVWLVNRPGDPWPIHALVRIDGDIYDAGGRQSEADIRSYLSTHLEVEPDGVDLERHVDEHDSESFEIPDETAMAQSVIDERLVPVVRDGASWE